MNRFSPPEKQDRKLPARILALSSNWDRGTAAGKPLVFPLSFLGGKSLFPLTFF